METMRVIFRADKHGEFRGCVTAFFPDIDEGNGLMRTYQHIGQHSGGAVGYYHRTRPATPEEYASLLAELRGIYEAGDDAVKLVICKRR